MKKYLKKLIGGVLILGLFASLIGCSSGSKERLEQEKVEVKEYLKEKYGKEFVITDAEYYRANENSRKTIVTYAHPADDPDLEFWVQGAVEGGDYRIDFYLREYWGKEGQKMLKPLMDELYGDTILFEVGAGDGAKGGELYKKMWGRVPSLEEIIRDYPTAVSINASIFDVYDDNFRVNESERVFKVIKELRIMQFDKIGIYFDYFSNDFEEDYTKIMENKNWSINLINVEISDTKGEAWGARPYYKWDLTLFKHDTSKINESSDVIDRFDNEEGN